VFFCRGDLIKNHLTDLSEAVEYGYCIGNHAYDHQRFSLLPLTSCIEQIKKTDDLIGEIYRNCGISVYHKLFRFPYGDKGDFKFGFDLSPFSNAFIKGQAGPGKKLCQIFQLLSKAGFEHYLSGKNRHGMIRKEQIQTCLRDLGYVRPEVYGITYSFYQQMNVGYDWNWTFDVREWRYNNDWNRHNFLRYVCDRIDADDPVTDFGCISEPHGLNYLFSNDLVLLHDHTSTSWLFYRIIEYMEQKGITFLDPLTGLKKDNLA